MTNSGEKCLIIVSAKIDEHLGKSYEKCEQNNGSWAKVHKIQTSVTRRKKWNSMISFYFEIPGLTSFLMIPLTTVYDEYIDKIDWINLIV